jgi:hypothetical protein
VEASFHRGLAAGAEAVFFATAETAKKWTPAAA